MKNNSLSLNRRSLGSVMAIAVLVAVASCWLLVPPAAASGKSSKDKTRKVFVEASKDHKAYLGIAMQELTSDVRKGLDTNVKRGVLVASVMDDSPAAEAGIREGDIIVEFNGHKVDSPEALQNQIAEMKDGDAVKVKIARGDDTKTFDVTLGDWADQPMVGWFDQNKWGNMMPRWHNYVAALYPKRLGVDVSSIDDDLGSYFGVKGGEGVLVLDVDDESTAESMGIKSGDVITKVEDNNIESAGDIRQALSDVDQGDEIHLTVVRNKKKVELKGELKESNDQAWWGVNAPRFRAFSPRQQYDTQELRKEIDQLRKEVNELKEQMKKS